ncbi:response regulator [Pseudomonas sp. J452]|uniref:response regulator n=1 Tax=Pseudomonas sp. J452 TaxID=2898441 RepID=UPI0021ADA933|nr:response regulator [Pseudomonas sp. J452]UUY06488.1 response regulator [Pseudomonas sp. J452]
MRVLILDDDPWIADLLKQIVLSVRPSAQVDCFGEVQSAFAAWQQTRYQLVLADWNLPDASGVSLLQQVREQDREVPLVMITGRSDRQSVMTVRPLGISAFITKPFEVPRVAQCIEQLLPADGNPRVSPDIQEDFASHLAGLAASALDLPLLAQVKEKLQLGYRGEQLDFRQLADDWQHDPALCAHLLAAANSATYAGAGQQCTSLSDALKRLGARTSINLAIGFALKQSNTQSNLMLSVLVQSHLEASQRLAERVVALAQQVGQEPAPLHTAALLHRIGELCVIYQAQEWEDRGHSVSENVLLQAVSDFAAPLAIKLKAHWALPMVLRELIGAVYALPPTQVRREQVLMRLAAALNNAEPAASVDRLQRLAGLA